MTRSLLFALALTLIAGPARGYTVPEIWIESNALETGGYTDGEGVRLHLQGMLMQTIKQAFPCVSMLSRDDAHTMLDFVRQRERLGYSGLNPGAQENDLGGLGGAAQARFFILAHVNGAGKTAEMTVNFYDRRFKKNNISLRRTATGPGDAAFGPIQEMVEELVRKMAYLEICPYTGPVTITVNSSRKKDEVSEYAVSCNALDGMFKRRQQEDFNVVQQWRLHRSGNPDVSGEMTATIHDVREDREENSCYSCASGRKGGRTHIKTTTIKAEVNGLSNRSRVPGEQENHDATVRLSFARNGSYTISVNGSSQAANYRGKIQETTEGTCDLVNTTVELKENDVLPLIQYNRSLPLTVPKTTFPGTPFDKRLTGKQEIPLHDPLTGEDATITLEFDLHRK